MKTRRLPCGCHCSVGDREMWTAMCPTHQAEADAVHARWQAEHPAAMASFYAEPRREITTRNTTRIGRTP